ncbi:MAG TPA: hypothetical protein VLU98_03020 [Methanomicrobiales archaeon]|nr:hypothetical protein [Methanomicrobiales archaeon]
MTAEFESLAEILLMILVITCIAQLVLAVLLFRYMKRVADGLGAMKAAPAAPATPFPLPSAAPATGAGEPGTVPPPAKAEPAGEPPVPAVDLIGESPDIQGSIQRLCEKYGLSDFIIATLDGLVVVSLSPGSSEEAARFSDLHRRKKKPDSPGVAFLDIMHRGEPMLGIARSDHPLPAGRLNEIGADARKILQWWL